MTRIGFHVGQDWWTFLSTYPDHTPILDISCGSVTVAISIADRQITGPALDFARELASQAARFAAEVERLHARQSGTGEASANGEAGNGEAA